MTTTPTICVSATSTRAELEAAIGVKRREQMRLPLHWHERRAAIGDAIDEMVDLWLAAAE